MIATLWWLLFTLRASHALSEAELAYPARLQMFYQSGQGGSFAGQPHGEQAVHIAYRYFLNSSTTKAIIVLPGFSENIEKYSEVAIDLHSRGYSVFLLDHRGQGFSDRLLVDSHRATLDNFDNLIADLNTYYSTIVEPKHFTEVNLLAHSMGGAVAARYLEKFSDRFHAAVLSAPMFEINLHGIPNFAANALLWLLNTFGWQNLYVHGPSDPLQFAFAGNTVTHSQIRYDQLNLHILKVHPEAQVWGLTAHWLSESLHGLKQVADDAAKIRTRMLMFQAGHDELVHSEGMTRLCKRILNCRIEAFSESFHEILMESDSIRDRALDLTLRFFELP